MLFFMKKSSLTEIIIARSIIFAFILLAFFYMAKSEGTAKTKVNLSHFHEDSCFGKNSKEAACGKNDGTFEAELCPSKTGWTNENVILTMELNYFGNIAPAENPFSWNGGKRKEKKDSTATVNGTYTCKVYTNDGRSEELSVTISNIDKTKPSFEVSLSNQAWTRDNITMTIKASDSESGLASKPYSFDGGKSFTSSASMTINQNGSYCIQVKDKAGNISEKTVKVDNSDTTAPQISFFGPTEDSWTNKDVYLSVKASDSQSGLPKYPYSFNGGENFTANTEYKVSNNGSYKVVVRDSIGNQSSAVCEVKCIDRDTPVIKSVNLSNSQWTGEEVTLTVEASDATSGIGKGYSYDGGKTFSDNNTYKVSKNSTVNIVVADKAGNTASKAVKISNIDNRAPEINSVVASTSKWNNKGVEIKVEASDSESGLEDAPYSFDGGRTYSASPSYRVMSNGKINICVKDKAGNVNSTEYEVENLDFDPPVIEDMYLDNADWTRGKIKVKAVASDKLSGLSESAFSFNSEGFSASDTYLVDCNGKVTVTVKDKAGNVATKSITVSNIDKKLPTITSVASDKSDWTSGNVKITVEAWDDESGLAAEGYSFDGGKSFSSENTFTVSSNCKVSIAVKDKAGNIAGKEYSVCNIDKTAPSVSIDNAAGTGWSGGNISLKINASDIQSGLMDKAYSRDGKNYSSQTNFDISQNGSYTFFVKDKAGNVTQKSITVNNIDKTAPSIMKVSKSSDDWVKDGLTITVEAADRESGLADKAFSFDGGNKYTQTASAYIKSNGDYKVCVRDRAGNVSEKTITVTNIGKNPSDLEEERRKAQEEADRKEEEKKLAEEEKKEAEKALERRKRELEQAIEKVNESNELLVYLEEAYKNLLEEKEKLLSEINECVDKPQKEELDKQYRTLLQEEEKLLADLKAAQNNNDNLTQKKNDIEEDSSRLEKNYLEKTKNVLTLEEKQKAAALNSEKLGQQIEEEKKSDLFVNIYENFRKTENDITPVEIDEEGDFKKVSVKELVSINDLESTDYSGAASEALEDNEIESDSGRFFWLKAGLILLLLGALTAMSLNYIYLYEDKKLKKVIFVKSKRDKSRIVISVPKGKMKEEGKYNIFHSGITRLLDKNKPVYVSVEGQDNIYNTREGKSFEYCVSC